MDKKKDSIDQGSGDRRNSDHHGVVEPDFGDPDGFVNDIPDEDNKNPGFTFT